MRSGVVAKRITKFGSAGTRILSLRLSPRDEGGFGKAAFGALVCDNGIVALSGNQIRNLGIRLRDVIPPHDEDLELYLDMCVERYQGPRDRVVETIQDLDLSVVTRFKTSRTLIEKLQRTPGITLGYINDVAGARVVIDGGRAEQDEIVAQLVERLHSTGSRTRVVDRRADPSHGYRAVHIIVKIDRVPIEIQVRTKLQDLWANVMEKFADLYGRQVRYGEPPDHPDESIHPDLDVTPRSMYERILGLSTAMHAIETLRGVDEAMPEQFVFTDELDYEGLEDEEVEVLKGRTLTDVLKDSEDGLERALQGVIAVFDAVGAD